MLNILLFIINISIIFNELTPDKDNAISLGEYEFKCKPWGSTGTQTYKINNVLNKKYIILIKPILLKEFAIYAGNTKLNYETYTNNDYFYPIYNKNILYLVVNLISGQCISIKFVNTNSLILENNIEFKYPVVASSQEITATARNVYNKHFIFYLNHTYQYKDAGYSIKVNGISYSRYPGTKVFSYIPKSNELQLKVIPPGEQIIATLKYISIPYINITDDEIKCITDLNSPQSFFINRSKKNYRYFWYFLLDNYGAFYDNEQQKTELSYLDTCYPWNYEHFILLNFGCFQIKYTNDSRKYNIDIKDNDFFMITNTNTYNFIYIRDGSKKNINLTISSSKNNFINTLKINNILQTLEVKNNMEQNFNYFYNIIFSTYKSEIKFDINFNTDFLFIDFQIKEYIPQKENKEDKGLSVIGIILIIVIFLFFGMPFILSCLNKLNDFREKRKYRNECQLIENFYDLIRQDCEEINKVCLICFRNEKKMPILNENDDDNKINFSKYDYNFNVHKNYIIDDINNGIFTSLLDYITPKKCEHLYHKKCANFKSYKDCLFCQLLITSKNLKNFGLFISKGTFNDLLKKKNFSKTKKEKMNE